MEEIYILARESFKGGQKAFDVHAYPFRMTKKNLRRHRRNKWAPFWKDLKKGYDHFEAVHQPPPVAVCEKRYLVNVAFSNGVDSLDPEAECPEYQNLPREAVPPPPIFREAKHEDNGPAPVISAGQQASLGVPARAPVSQAAVRQPANRAPAATAHSAAAQASIGNGTAYTFAPSKPTVAGFAFRLNSKLDQ